MQVEQAVFTSARTRYAKGYHLVARSPGIDERLAQLLTVWGPSHNSLLSPQPEAVGLNWFAVDDDRFVLSRTTYGGSEYSDRGGFSIQTSLLILHARQLKGYDFNPMLVARTARALGYLRAFEGPEGRMAAAEVPVRTFAGYRAAPRTRRTQEAFVSHVTCVLQNGQRVAVTGVDDPVAFLWDMMEQISPGERLKLSFTTGLRPTVQRPFRLHFVPANDAEVNRQLGEMGIERIDADFQSSSKSFQDEAAQRHEAFRIAMK